MGKTAMADTAIGRLHLLNLEITNARWLYILIFTVYGISLKILTRVLNFEDFLTDDLTRAPLSRIATIAFFTFNSILWIYLKKKKDFTWGQIKFISFCQVAGDFIFTSFYFHLQGGMEGPGALLFLFPLVSSAILFSPIGVGVTAILIIISSSSLTYLDKIGFLKHFPLYSPKISSQVYEHTLALTFTLLVLILTVIGLAIYFGLTSRTLRSIEDSLRQRTKELTIERNKIEAIVTNLVDGLVFLDKNKRVILMNPEAKSVLNLTELQFLGKTINEIVGVPNIVALYDVLDHKIEWSGKRYELMLQNPLKKIFQVFIAPVTARDKEIIGLTIILHDITREKEIETLKTEFVSMAAHQLRTPLTGTKWAFRTIMDNPSNKISNSDRDLLERGFQNNENMIELVNNLLNIARIEEGRFIYDMSEVYIDDMAQKQLDRLKTVIEKKNLKVTINKPRELPEIQADKEKINLVIQNLIENAIKYSPIGATITITVTSTEHDVKFAIQDTGFGVPENQRGEIFNKFVRGTNVLQMGIEGTGLGLFLARQIIEKHGGKLWLMDEIRQGSTFIFTLPRTSLLKIKEL